MHGRHISCTQAALTGRTFPARSTTTPPPQVVSRYLYKHEEYLELVHHRGHYANATGAGLQWYDGSSGRR